MAVVETPSPVGGNPSARMAALAESAGLRRVHIVAWRDCEAQDAGGSEEHAAQVATAWAAAGIDVTLRVGWAPGLPAESVRNGYRTVRRGGRMSVIPRTAISGLLGLDGPRDGLVEIFHGFSFLAPLWARGPRVAVVHHVHLGAWHLLAPAPLAALGHLFERFVAPPLYRRTDVLAVSPSTRDELVGIGFAPERITVELNGVAPHFRRGGIRSARPLVMAVGRLMPQKGFDEALRAFAAVRRQCPDARLVVVGEGPSRSDLESLARQLGIAASTTFTGRVSDDDLVAHYQSAWVVLNASRREGWGLTLAEAARCATPAVASRIPGHVDAVLDGETGLLADDRDGLVAATVRLLQDEPERRRLGVNAERRSQDFDWDRVAETTLSVLAADALRRRA